MSERAFKNLVLAYVDVVKAAVRTAAKQRKLMQWEQFIKWEKLHAMVLERVRALYEVEQKTGRTRARAASRRVKKVDVEGSIFFNEANPFAVDWAATRSSQFISMIDDSVREAVRMYVRDAIRDGTPIDSLAKQLDGVIGLRPDQVEALNKQRDKMLREGASQSEIDASLRARGSRMVSDRAVMIARTETNAAQNAGALNEWSAQVEAGDLPKNVEREWIAGQEGQCPICESLDGTHAHLDGTFHASANGKSYVAPPAHPGCRCSQGLV